MFGPVLGRFDVRAGVFVDESGGAGESDGEDIVVFVAVEVMDPSEEVVSVGVHRLWFCRVDFKGLFEFWTCEPVGAVDDISVTVAVEVTDGGTFAEVGIREGLALEGVDRT